MSSHLHLPVARLLLAAAAGLASVAADAGAAGEDAWIPARPGRVLTHVYQSSKVLYVHSKPVKQEVLRGTRRDSTLVADDRFGTSAVEIRSTLRTRRDSASGFEVKQTSEFVRPTAEAYRILGSELEWDGRRRLVRYPKPLAMLPDVPTIGVEWYVGRGVLDGLQLDIHGRILRIQDAKTPAGVFEKCLVVEYTRRIAGRAEDSVRGSLDILDGISRTTVWYARGIGQVLTKDTTEMKIRIPGTSTQGVARAEIQTALEAVESAQTLPARSER